MAKDIQSIIDGSRRIVFFTGAGVSTESGIPDFRSAGGLYNEKNSFPPEEILSHEFFFSHTEEFYDFYRNRMIFKAALPNAAHFKMYELERVGRAQVVTQNIDGLHAAAGSRRVHELHGSIYRNRCVECKKQYPIESITESAGVPRCSCGGIIKPDVVLYDEELDEKTLTGAVKAISEADTVIVAGTSLAVYPAAGLLRYFVGGNLVVINKSATPADASADLVLRDPVAAVMEKISL